jgi:Kef-type K+ transport system membrane component KefB
MRRDVFGLGFAQLIITSFLAALASPLVIPNLTTAAKAVIGSGLALSSSAFVLQLLREKNEVNTKHGRAAFGILLFQVRTHTHKINASTPYIYINK